MFLILTFLIGVLMDVCLVLIQAAAFSWWGEVGGMVISMDTIETVWLGIWFCCMESWSI